MSTRSVLTSLKVMEELAEHQPIGVSDLARLLDLPKTTVHRTLRTLAEAGWIASEEGRDARWSLSLRALSVGGRAVDSHRGLRGIAVPVLEDLRRATEETASLVVRDNLHIVLIERLDGIKPVRLFNPVGGRGSVFRTSSGKAILARLPAAELRTCLDALERRAGQPGIPTVEDLLAELELVRKRGFSINLGVNQSDVHGVAAAVSGHLGRPVAAVTVVGPPERFSEQVCMTLGPMVVDAARRVSLGLRTSR